MFPVEANILAALRRQDVWERYHQFFSPSFFPSSEAKKVRKALAALHQDCVKAVVPASWIENATGHKIPQPLPTHAAEELLQQELIKGRIEQWIKWMTKDVDSGEAIRLESITKDISELQEILNGGSNNGQGRAPLLASDLVQNKVWEDRGSIPTFLHKDLDRYLGGGVGRGQLCLLQAPAKHGKTTLLLTIAYRAACKGLRTIFLSSENYLDQLGERLAGIHQVAGKKAFPKHFHIDFRYRMSIPEAREILSHLDKADVIVFDYADNMHAVTTDGDDFVWSINELYDGMRAIANERNAIVWTATQEKDPETPWTKVSSRSRTYGSDKKFHKCDLFLGCLANPKSNTLSISVLARRGRGKMGETFHAFFDQDTGALREIS